MKSHRPVYGSNELLGGVKRSYCLSAPGESGARQLYRSVILAVSGSLFCAAAADHAAAQSTLNPQTGAGAGNGAVTLAETAQSLPPTEFNGFSTSTSTSAQNTQWSVQSSLPFYSLDSSVAAVAPQDSSPGVGVAPAVPQSSDATSDTVANVVVPTFPIVQPTVHKNEVSASADFMFGTGTITVPIGYGLRAAALHGASFPVNAVSADRSTIYYGGTVSYSYGRSWYLDFSGENGRSTGSTSISIPGLAGGAFPANFDVNDTWYQIYLRYNFQDFLAGTRFRAYLRGGMSLVSATLTTANNAMHSYGAGNFYSEHDDTFDVLGNLGFGLTYSVYSTVRLKVGLQLEGEGFGGNRSQDIDESYVPSNLTGKTTIDNTVYGAIGRLTLHADYRLGQSGRWKLTGDIGVMTKNSFVTYSDFGTKDENLYGPYAKVGASYVF